MTPDIRQLPGADLVAKGLADLSGNLTTPESLLIEIAASALRAVGVPVPPLPVREYPAELALYQLLQAQGTSDAYRRYNSLLRELVSFRRAAETLLSKTLMAELGRGR